MELSCKELRYMKKIEILGTGCPKCNKLVEQVQRAANELKLDCQIEKVESIQKIIAHGVMMTPALVVDGRVKVTGKVPSLEDIKTMIGQD
jgi:small redox-active disulfide protein 2